jgi:CheY-like chemotaxis protein
MANDSVQNGGPAVPVAEKQTLPPWNVLLIEDDPTTVRQIREFFATREIDGRQMAFQEITRWEEAFGLVRERKADLAILDIYRGQAAHGGERVGEKVLNDLQHSGFIPVIIHTNLPEGLEGLQNEFVRLVLKTDGLPKLEEQIDALFKTRVPQMHRAIQNHLDRALCEYMWGFVAKEWTGLKEIADRPEFLRLLLHRLAFSFARSGVEQAVAEAFTGYKGEPLDSEKVHPAEFYIMPPVTTDPVLGDIRVRKVGEKTEYLVVLWPSCDMVSTAGRKPKTESVLCARANPLATCSEVTQFVADPSNNKRTRLKDLMANNANSSWGSAESAHFLPGFLAIPDLVVEFRKLEVPTLEELKKFQSVGVVASPYAEQMSVRFDSFRGRVGVPDLDFDHVIGQLTKTPTATKKT